VAKGGKDLRKCLALFQVISNCCKFLNCICFYTLANVLIITCNKLIHDDHDGDDDDDDDDDEVVTKSRQS